MPQVDIVFIGKDQVSKTMKGIGGSFAGLGKTVAKVGLAMGATVAAGAVAAGGALAAFTGSGIQKAARLEQQMADVASVMGKTAGEIKPLKKLALDLSVDPKLKVSAFEAADAIELLARNGVEMEKITGGMAKGVVVLANAANAEFGPAADVATDVMALWTKQGIEMNDVNKGIVSVLNKSKFSFDDYRLALANGGSAAAGLGVELEDFNAIIALTASNFDGGSQAGTGFRNFIQRLVPNTDKAAQMMQELGLITEDGQNKFFNASGQLKDMDEIVRLLSGAMGGLSEQQTATFVKTVFGQDAMGTLMGIVEQGPEKFLALKDAMAQVDPAAAVATRMDTLSGAFEILQGTIEGVSIRIGDAFLPGLKLIVAAVQNFVDQHGDAFITWFEKAGVWIGTNLPVAIKILTGFWTNSLLPAMMGVWSFIQSSLIPFLTTMGGMLGGSLVAQGQVFAGLWTSIIQPALSTIWQFIQGKVIPILIVIGDWLGKKLPQFATAASNAFKEFRDKATQWFNDFKEKAGPIVEGFINRFNETWSKASPTIVDALTRIGIAFGKIISVLFNTERESSNTEGAITILQEVLDATVIAVQALTVGLELLARGFEATARAIQIAKDLANQIGTIFELVGRKIPDVLKPGSPPPLAIAMQQIGEATAFAAGKMGKFGSIAAKAGSDSDKLTETAKELSDTAIAGGKKGAGTMTGAQTVAAGMAHTKMLEAQIDKPPEPEPGLAGKRTDLIGQAQRQISGFFKSIFNRFNATITPQMIEFRKKLAGLGPGAKFTNVSEFRKFGGDINKKLEFQRAQLVAQFGEAGGKAFDAKDFIAIAKLEMRQQLGKNALSLASLKGTVRDDKERILGFDPQLAFDVFNKNISASDAIEQAMNLFVAKLDKDIANERQMAANTQNMNLTINSSAPTENVMADFDSMKARIPAV